MFYFSIGIYVDNLSLNSWMKVSQLSQLKTGVVLSWVLTSSSTNKIEVLKLLSPPLTPVCTTSCEAVKRKGLEASGSFTIKFT